MSTSSDVSNFDARTRGGLAAKFKDVAAAGRVRGLAWTDRLTHWGLRIPLGGVLIYMGLDKFPDALVDPSGYGVPPRLFTAAAFAEILGPLALMLGGIVETLRPALAWLRFAGDVLTRLGGFAATAALLGVIYYFLGGDLPVHDPHAMLLGVAVFFLLRGNKYGAQYDA